MTGQNVITVFQNLRMPIGSLKSIDWPSFFAEIERDVRTEFKGDDHHPGWSPTAFDGNRRKLHCVQHVHAIVLDFDKATDTVAAISARWADYQHCVHTTRKNASHDAHRARLILPTTRPMTPTEHARILDAISKREPNIDPQTKDASRFWFAPGSNFPEFAACIVHLSGRAIDPDVDFKSALVESAVQKIKTAPKGSRNAVFNTETFKVSKAGAATGAAVTRLQAAAIDAGLDPEEVRRTTRSAALAGTATVTDIATGKPVEVATDGPDFTRGDHVEVATNIYEDAQKYEPLGHDGLGFYTYKNGVWHAYDRDELLRKIMRYAGSTVGGKISALKLSAGAVEGIAQLVATLAKKPFDTASAGVTFTNTRLEVSSDGLGIVETYADADDLERHALGYAYSPDAKAPRFLQMLRDIFGDELNPRAMILQEFAGAAMFNCATKYQKAIILLGAGGNGKSQLLEAVSCLFARRSIASLPVAKWGRDFTLASLIGKRVNLVNEMPQHESLDPDVFKNIVTGEPLEIDVKYAQPQHVRLRAGHLFSANKLPETSDHSDGFFRRFMLIELTRKFENDPSRVLDLGQWIAAHEAQGVAAWAVEGMRRLASQNHYTGHPEGDTLVQEWRDGANSVKMYIKECLVHLKGDYNYKARDLYMDFARWAFEGGYAKLSERTFAQRMKAEGIDKVCHSGAMKYPVRKKGPNA